MKAVTPAANPHRLELAAYHEAGHAAVAIHEHVDIERITIVPTDEDDSSVVQAKTSAVKSPAEAMFRLSQQARINLAGEISVRRFRPRAHRWNEGRDDRRRAIEFAESLTGESAGHILVAQLKLLRLQTESIVERSWAGIVAIAQALLERRTLTGSEAHEIYRSAMMAAANGGTAVTADHH